MAKAAPQATKSTAAVADLIEIADYIAEHGSLAAADHFLLAAEETFTRLAAMPGSGIRYNPHHPALGDLRVTPVSGFRNYVVFYRPVEGGIRVVRLLHGARDIQRIIADEFGIAEEPDASGEE